MITPIKKLFDRFQLQSTLQENVPVEEILLNNELEKLILTYCNNNSKNSNQSDSHLLLWRRFIATLFLFSAVVNNLFEALWIVFIVGAFEYNLICKYYSNVIRVSIHHLWPSKSENRFTAIVDIRSIRRGEIRACIRRLSAMKCSMKQ